VPVCGTLRAILYMRFFTDCLRMGGTRGGVVAMRSDARAGRRLSLRLYKRHAYGGAQEGRRMRFRQRFLLQAYACLLPSDSADWKGASTASGRARRRAPAGACGGGSRLSAASGAAPCRCLAVRLKAWRTRAAGAHLFLPFVRRSYLQAVAALHYRSSALLPATSLLLSAFLQPVRRGCAQAWKA